MHVRDALVRLHTEHNNDVARLLVAEALAGFERAGTAGRD